MAFRNGKKVYRRYVEAEGADGASLGALVTLPLFPFVESQGITAGCPAHKYF